MKLIPNLTILLIMLTLLSCQSQIDLSTISFQDNVDNIIKDKNSFFSDNIHPSTGLPILYTYDIEGYNYGTINLKSNPEENLGKNMVGFFLYEPYSKKENKVAGIMIEYNDQNNLIFDELVKTHGKPEHIAEEPITKVEGVIHGISAYKWSPSKEYTILLTKSYSSKNKAQDITTSVYVISNEALDQTDKSRKSVERLIQTFKE